MLTTDQLTTISERCEAMERACKGHCYCCTNAKSPGIKTATGFPSMIACEYLSVLAVTGETGRDCEHWVFDEVRFAGSQDHIVDANEMIEPGTEQDSGHISKANEMLPTRKWEPGQTPPLGWYWSFEDGVRWIPHYCTGDIKTSGVCYGPIPTPEAHE